MFPISGLWFSEATAVLPTIAVTTTTMTAAVWSETLDHDAFVESPIVFATKPNGESAMSDSFNLNQPKYTRSAARKQHSVSLRARAIVGKTHKEHLARRRP